MAFDAQKLFGKCETKTIGGQHQLAIMGQIQESVRKSEIIRAGKKEVVRSLAAGG